MMLTPFVTPVTTGTITGIVTLSDATNHEGIFIYLAGTSNICITNSSGEFNLNGVVPGNYVLKASKEGYNTASITTTASAGESTDVGQHSLSPVVLDILRTLTITSTLGGTFTPASPKIIVRGMPLDIVAAPIAGYRFVNWSVIDGNAVFENANQSQTTVTLNSTNATIRANFSEIIYTLTARVNRLVAGTCTPSTASSTTYGVPIPISATSSPNDTFTGWTVISGTATFGNASSATTNVTLTSTDVIIQANFSAKQYTVTLEERYGYPCTFDFFRISYTMYNSYDELTIPQKVSVGVRTFPGYSLKCWNVIGNATMEDIYSERTNLYCFGGPVICEAIIIDDSLK
jgi:hypothetical protein